MDNLSDTSDTSDLADMYDTIHMGENEDPINIEDVALFAVKCIDYVMRWNGLRWFPPVHPRNISRFALYDYFSNDIGEALVHYCMDIELWILGELAHFNVEEWLQLTVDESRIYIDTHLHEFLFILPTQAQDSFVNLYIWAFASDLCVTAVKSNKSAFVSQVLSKLINIMFRRFPISKHYYDLNNAAFWYNNVHRLLHNLSGDEGYGI